MLTTAVYKDGQMSNTVLQNVRERYIKAAATLGLEDYITEELLGFKLRLSFEMPAKVGGKQRHLKVVRVWHRRPLARCAFKGGMRFFPGTTLSALESHAAEMSVKCWLHDLPYGGAKGGIDLHPAECSPAELEAITKKMVEELDDRKAIGPFVDVPAPDMGTNALIMFYMADHYAHIHDGEPYTNGVVTGKPVDKGYDYIGGIHGRKEATGYGLNVALEVFRNPVYKMISIAPQPTMIVQGFGNVGYHAAKFAEQNGVRIVAISDVQGAIYNPHGINVEDLEKYCRDNPKRSVVGYPKADSVKSGEFLELPCDILVPAAVEETITKANASRIKASVILEGANGPTTPEADEILAANGKVVIPDVLANSGGVTVSYFEWGRNTDQTDTRIPDKNDRELVLGSMAKMMEKACGEVYRRAQKYKSSLREAAYIVALEKAELLRARRMPEYAANIFG